MAMAGGEAGVLLVKSPQQYTCVEIYLPKRIDYLSGLYDYLKTELEDGDNDTPIKGFSIYEVDGAWQGTEQICDERTLVIRILFNRPDGQDELEEQFNSRVADIGRQISALADDEKVIWICSYPQIVRVFETNA